MGALVSGTGTLLRPSFTWQLRTRTLALGERTLLMGIVNVTPDSFSDGGQFLTADAATRHALQLFEEGADVIDLGGESTRPGASPISAAEEQDRVLPVLRAVLQARPQAVVSVDTYHASTAEAAITDGAEIINDVSGLLWDPAMAGVLARARPGVILMHTRGRPTEWANLPDLAPEVVLPTILEGLAKSLRLAATAGIGQNHILLDPGFGFGKRGAENETLLEGFSGLQSMGYPLLAGVSRKRFLTAQIASPTMEQRIQASVAANMVAILAGAHVVRVHDVAATKAVAKEADRLLTEVRCLQ